MAVTTFHDFPLPRDHAWDGAAAEKRVRAWAGAHCQPSRAGAMAPALAASSCTVSITSAARSLGNASRRGLGKHRLAQARERARVERTV